MLEIAIHVDTPHQLWVALNVNDYIRKKKPNARVDLFFGSYGPLPLVFADRIKKVSLFNTVYTYHFNVNASPIIIRLAENVIPEIELKKRIHQMFSISEHNYNMILCGNITTFVRMLRLVYPKAIFGIYDEGIGTYYNHDVWKPTFIQKCLSLLRFRFYPSLFPEYRFVFNKKLLEKGIKGKIIQLHSPTEALSSLIEHIWDYKGNCIYNDAKIIYLTLPGEMENMYDTRDLTLEVLGSKCIIRNHPREKQEFVIGKYKQDTTNMCWELIVKEYVDDDTVLIADNSSAQLAPKLYYGKEPYLIYTFMLHKEIMNDSLSIASNIRNLYTNKEKVIIVKTKEEYYDLLKKLKSTY